MTKTIEEELYELFPRPKDDRVYLISPLITDVAKHGELNSDQRKAIAEFPKLIELLDYVAASPRFKNVTKHHISFGPEATVETVAEELLKLEIALDNGDYEVIDRFPDSDSKQIDVEELVKK